MTRQSPEFDWAKTKDLFRRGFRSSMHCAIATVGDDGGPHVTPIGSVILTDPGQGIFFDIFTSQLASNLDNDPRVCVLAVNSGRTFWLKSMVKGRFERPPALRLVGTVGPRRRATTEEQHRWLRRTRLTRWLPGYALLWSNLDHVRDLTFHTTVPVDMGPMTPRSPNEVDRSR